MTRRGKTNERWVREVLGDRDYEEFQVFKKIKWVGPFSIDDLLNNCLDDSSAKPPESHSVYLVSRKSWVKHPSPADLPLYVGSTTGKTSRFRTRIGDMIIDAFGFFQDDTGHSSGGISLHQYCLENGLNPKAFYVGWLANCGCTRCAEYYFWDFLKPMLNKNRPPKCNEHRTWKDMYSAIMGGGITMGIKGRENEKAVSLRCSAKAG